MEFLVAVSHWFLALFPWGLTSARIFLVAFTALLHLAWPQWWRSRAIKSTRDDLPIQQSEAMILLLQPFYFISITFNRFYPFSNRQDFPMRCSTCCGDRLFLNRGSTCCDLSKAHGTSYNPPIITTLNRRDTNNRVLGENWILWVPPQFKYQAQAFSLACVFSRSYKQKYGKVA